MSADEVIFGAVRKAQGYIDDAIADVRESFSVADIAQLRERISTMELVSVIALWNELEAEGERWFGATPSERRKAQWTDLQMAKLSLLHKLTDAQAMLPLIAETNVCDAVHDWRSFSLASADLFRYARAEDDPLEPWPFDEPDPYANRSNQGDNHE